MKTLAGLTGLLFLLQAPAGAGEQETSFTRSEAIALAALVAENSPLLGAEDKGAMAKLLEGQSNFPFPANRKIVVLADRIVCTISRGAMLAWSCVLTFGTTDVSVTGRKAHELFETLDVDTETAAGTVGKTLTKLKCTIDPHAAFQNDDQDNVCTFD